MSVLDDIYRRRREACSGRIYTRSGNWVFSPTQAQIKRTVQKNPHAFMEGTDAAGRKMYLIMQRGILCPNSEIASEKYPKSPDSERWFVPLSHCRKCQHYRKSTRQRRGGDAGAARETLKVLASAVKLADEMIGR